MTETVVGTGKHGQLYRAPAGAPGGHLDGKGRLLAYDPALGFHPLERRRVRPQPASMEAAS